MKNIFYLSLLLLSSNISAQIITPTIKAGFGIDGDLRANYFNNLSSPASLINDDWFNKEGATPGIGIIDTAGAAEINARYAVDPAFRRQPLTRGMSVPAMSVVNNKLIFDAIFYRDYHGSDSTMFASGDSKNGQSPQVWNCPVTQSVPDKNDILDVMAHIRRDGPDNTDSLWLFGGVSIESTNGDRYFDFELYQTDIYFDRSALKFFNYGPDAGHTTWQFDAAGNIVTAGDAIFSASYGSSDLSSIEARIWVNRSSLSIAPASFNWSGTFDGDVNGSQFGYAGIQPKSAGAFYTGIESASDTWAGDYSLIRGDNSIATNYIKGQYMEFSINLTKLGLDSRGLYGNIGCSMPVKRLFVKSRASTSFTAQLKDFAGPVNLFEDFEAKTASDVSLYCGLVGPAALKVVNSIPGFEYFWSTDNGHILGDATGDSITVDSAGTYIVTQKMDASCPTFASDTLLVNTFNEECHLLQASIKKFVGWTSHKTSQLNWSVSHNNDIAFFEIETSNDGVHFSSFENINPYSTDAATADYDLNIPVLQTQFYRLKMQNITGRISYSNIIRLSVNEKPAQQIKIFPNPVKNLMRIDLPFAKNQNVQLFIFDAAGRVMRTLNASIQKGSQLQVSGFESWPDGIYTVKILLGDEWVVKKMILRK